MMNVFKILLQEPYEIDELNAYNYTRKNLYLFLVV